MGTLTIINWQLSQQAIHWPVSRDYIAGSGLELIKVACFFKLTADQLLVYQLDHKLKSRYFSWGRRKEYSQRQNFGTKLTPGALLTFLLTHSLYNRLLESPWYIAYYVISTILVRHVGYGLLKFNWKKYQNHTLNNNITIAHNWSFFEFLIEEKIILFFLYRQLLQSRAPLLGLAKSIYYIYLDWYEQCTPHEGLTSASLNQGIINQYYFTQNIVYIFLMLISELFGISNLLCIWCMVWSNQHQLHCTLVWFNYKWLYLVT